MEINLITELHRGSHLLCWLHGVLILLGAIVDTARGSKLWQVRVEFDLSVGQHLKRVV